MRIRAAILIVVCAISFFVGLGANAITRSQEGRVLEVAREMRENGDYLTPRLIGQPRFEKPPLLYWITAAAYALLGEVNELGGRVPVALFGTGCVLLLYMLGRRHVSERAGFLAGLALATGPLFVHHARLAETDVPQAFFITAALLGFLEEQPLLAWMLMGVGFLNKGPGALVIPFATLVGYRWWTCNLRALGRDCRWPLIVLFLAIGSSWYLAVLWAHQESLKIFTTELTILAIKAEERHTEGFFFYFGKLLNFSPWALIAVTGLPCALRELHRQHADPGGPGVRGLKFALAWFLGTFVILMVTKNKQQHYLIALLPSCALLAGWVMDRLVAWRTWVLPAALVVGLVMAAGNSYHRAFYDAQHSEDAILRDFARQTAELLLPDEEFCFLHSRAYGRNLIALAYYSRRMFTGLDEASLAERARTGHPLAVVTTAGPLPAPLRQVLRARVGSETWSLWKSP